MKKWYISLLLIAASLVLSACSKSTESGYPMVEPTQQDAFASTAMSTEQPTEEPTEAPTEAPTPEPTETPMGTKLDFDACAELVMRLPWGSGDNEVFIRPLRPGNDDDDWEIPQHFNIIDGKVCVFDRYSPFGSGLLKCDPETGETVRISLNTEDAALENGEFEILDGKLIFRDCMYDLETRERIELDPLPGTPAIRDGVLMMKVRDGKCFAFRAVNAVDDYGQEFLDTQATYAYDVFELDFENRAWVQRERIEMPGFIPHAEPPFSDYDVHVYSKGYSEVIGKDDGALICNDRYMGTDDAGNHYVDSEELLAYKNELGQYVQSKVWRRIIKLSPEGVPVSYVDVSYPANYIFRIWDNYLVYKVDGDGTVWYMCETTEAVLIYKIRL